MKNILSKIKLFVFPAIAILWGIYIFFFFDPFYSRSIDPEFPYLVNGLNCAQAKFNYIGHFDHPGTPFQVFNGIVIKITHLFSGKGDIVQDVFARPEHYMNAISTALLLLQAILIFLVGLFGSRRKIPFWQIAILQASFIFSNELIWLFVRVNPDRFFMISGLLFILVYLKHGYENRSPLKFALWSGVVMALGFATKFNFLPLLFLPLLFIRTNKNRLIYAGSGIVSFFIFISPIINRFGEFRRFISGIFEHDGLYGGGDSNILNVKKMLESLVEIIRLNPGLLLLTAALVVLLIIALRRKQEGMKEFVWLFAGFLGIIVLQILMVMKHFKNYYLTPTFVFYGFMFFIISLFLVKIIQKKNHLILALCVLPLLSLAFSLVKVKTEHVIISKLISQREKIHTFVEQNISKDDFWFVEPTWIGAPFPENALVYGLSYCGHRENYQAQLKALNPNIITYEDNNETVRLWRACPASLDSAMATGKNIYVYSTPGRHAPVLIKMLTNTATRNNFQLKVDTIFSDQKTQNEIIRFKATNPNPNWHSGTPPVKDRESRIAAFVQSIKNSPDWLEKIKQKAILKKIPLDSMILLDAIYMVNIGK